MVGWLLVAVFAADAGGDWEVAVARIEGAATGVRESASHFRATAERVAASGRISSMAELRHDALDLERKILSAKLAAGVLAEANATPPAPN